MALYRQCDTKLSAYNRCVTSQTQTLLHILNTVNNGTDLNIISNLQRIYIHHNSILPFIHCVKHH